MCAIKGNKSFYCYMSSERTNKENTELLLKVDDFVTKAVGVLREQINLLVWSALTRSHLK